MQPRQFERITSVGLDAVAGSSGNERGRNNGAVMTGIRQLTLEPVATWTSLVAKVQLMVIARQPSQQLPQGVRPIGDLAIHFSFASLAARRQRN